MMPKSWGSSDYGRITAGAAAALKGRVELFYASPLFNRTDEASRWETAYQTNKQALQLKIKVNAESAIKEAELEKLNIRKKTIEAEMESVKDAKVIVSRLVFIGTSVKIGNRMLRVHETLESPRGITFATKGIELAMFDGEKIVARS